MSKIRLFSWNVNGLRAVLKKQAIQNFLSIENPDFCCFQEVKAKPEQVEKEILALPSAPRLVVINITPLAPRTPYMALAEASFNTEKDSI